MGRRILNDALRTIVNAEKRGKATANLQPVSNVMAEFLRVMKNRGYVKDFQVYDPHRVGKITVELQGRITDCRALMHRKDIKAAEIQEYTTRTLPTRQVSIHPSMNPNCSFSLSSAILGLRGITTPNGVLDHEEAIKQNVGGQVLGFFH
ncbi:unnamed protein product [Spirodela intermedia]|uniref:Small ribosomal subunit protein uS8c n=1 Tax=Spirodela intermedia TaxID=51605 RepID=A0A7I8JNC6_SPIIN|nr:unnamed protein product [Spirodela intermedia]CAA6671656.1 unnamed protein product [Spirodela intermedia]